MVLTVRRITGIPQLLYMVTDVPAVLVMLVQVPLWRRHSCSHSCSSCCLCHGAVLVSHGPELFS